MDEKDQNPNENILKFQLPPKPGSHGRAGRAHPHLADKSTENALKKLRKRAEQANAGKNVVDENGMVTLEAMDEDFCQYIVAGFSIAGAYRQAYQPAAPSDPKIAVKAYEKVRTNMRIIQRINFLLIERRNSLVDDSERLRSFIRQRLEVEAVGAHEGSTRMKALELLGKMPDVCAFEERRVNVNVDENSSPERIKEELSKRLTRLGIKNPSA